MQHSILLAVLFCVVTFVTADGVVPTAPGPGDKFKAGSLCSIEWKAGSWTNFSIMLMSGSNLDMEPMKLVASGLNGSDASLSPFNWTCPDVTPYSAIYFYQFTNGNDTANLTWTTRFTIMSPSGDSVPPANATQSNGDPIPWGFGSLRDSTDATSTTASSSSSTFSTSPTSSGMRKAQFSTTSADRQATPTINLPSTSSANSVQGTFAARPAAQSDSGVMQMQVFSVWAVLALVSVPSFLSY